MNKCKDNPTLNKMFFIFIQVMFTFAFLTIFFFTYVQKSEKKSFETQMNIIVDDLVPDIHLDSFLPLSPVKKDFLKKLINGSLDVSKENSIKKSEKDDKKILENNRKIQDKAYKWLFIAGLIVIGVTLAIFLAGQCLPLKVHTKNAITIVFFVALTEFVFLNIITSHYWSVDPGQVRTKIAETIQGYVSVYR